MKVTPFSVPLSQRDLDELRDRLGRIRWPDQAPNSGCGSGWDYGVELRFLQQICDYWRNYKPRQYRERSAKPPRTYREPEVSGSKGGCGLLVNSCQRAPASRQSHAGSADLGGLARRQFPAEFCRSVAGLGFHSEQPARPDRVQRACRQSTADNRTGYYPPARLGCACGSWRPACVHQSLRAPTGSPPS